MLFVHVRGPRPTAYVKAYARTQFRRNQVYLKKAIIYRLSERDRRDFSLECQIRPFHALCLLRQQSRYFRWLEVATGFYISSRNTLCFSDTGPLEWYSQQKHRILLCSRCHSDDRDVPKTLFLLFESHTTVDIVAFVSGSTLLTFINSFEKGPGKQISFGPLRTAEHFSCPICIFARMRFQAGSK